MEKIIVCILKIFIGCIWGLAASAWTAVLLIPLAYECRGYFAIGGEWVVMTEVFALTFWIAQCLLKQKGDDLCAEDISAYDTFDTE